MKEQTIITNNCKTNHVVEFNSITEFYDYICKTPINEVFRWKELSSSKPNENNWYGTDSFEEATQLLKSGCEDISKKLNQKLNVNKIDTELEKHIKTIFDVQGFQCCVPLYLQGVPTNMISKKVISVKQKVITINKMVTYNCFTTSEQIIEESVKALQIIKKIESQGIRCNLNILYGSEESIKNKTRIICKIRVKNANERLNISKLSFCLVHPSMLRRLLFRFVEVYPNVTKYFVFGYGKAVTDKYQIQDLIEKLNSDTEYYIPSILNVDINSIKSLNDLQLATK